jgi:hypothetical protein
MATDNRHRRARIPPHFEVDALGVWQAQLGRRASFQAQLPLSLSPGLGGVPSAFPADAANLIFCPAQQVTSLVFVHESIMARFRRATYCSGVSQFRGGWLCPVEGERVSAGRWGRRRGPGVVA